MTDRPTGCYLLRVACTLVACLFLLSSPPVQAGWIEDEDGGTTIHVKLWSMPDPTRTDTKSQAQWAAVKRFIKNNDSYNGVDVEVVEPDTKYLEFVDRLKSISS